jgi:DNA-directed RNA polymerase subunit RPC12/RpoP
MVKVEIESQKDYKEVNISCPQCGSGNIRIDRRGYDYNKAACGMCCCGWPGLLFGGLDSTKLDGFCFNCGNKFDVESTLKNEWQDGEKGNEDQSDLLVKFFAIAWFVIITVLGFSISLALLNYDKSYFMSLAAIFITFFLDLLIIKFTFFPTSLSNNSNTDEVIQQEKDSTIYRSQSDTDEPEPTFKDIKEKELKSTVMYCSTCGKEIYKDDIFCKYCGNKI